MPVPSASAAFWHQVGLDLRRQTWPASFVWSVLLRAACVERQRFTRRVDSLTASRRRHLPNVDSRVITTTAPRRRGLIKTPSPRASALSPTRRDDGVRNGSNSKTKPPTASSDGGESRRWREGAAAPRDAEICRPTRSSCMYMHGANLPLPSTFLKPKLFNCLWKDEKFECLK